MKLLFLLFTALPFTCTKEPIPEPHGKITKVWYSEGHEQGIVWLNRSRYKDSVTVKLIDSYQTVRGTSKVHESIEGFQFSIPMDPELCQRSVLELWIGNTRYFPAVESTCKEK